MITLRKLFKKYNFDEITFKFPERKFKCKLNKLELTSFGMIGLCLIPILDKFKNSNNIRIEKEIMDYGSEYTYPQILDIQLNMVELYKDYNNEKDIAEIFFKIIKSSN